MMGRIFSVLSFINLLIYSDAFFQPSNSLLTNSFKDRTSSVFSKRPGGDLEDEIEYNSLQKAQGGAGELATGALLGGLILGPFGALFGAQLGAQMGAKNAVNRARAEEMKRLGITQEMLDATKDIGLALNQSVEGLETCRNSLKAQQEFSRVLDERMSKLYDKAKEELQAGKEAEAKITLAERNRLEEKLKNALKTCVAEKSRLEQMEWNVANLEERAKEMESLLRRTVGAKASMDSTSTMLSLGTEDPLLQKFQDNNNDEDPLLRKFRDAGID